MPKLTKKEEIMLQKMLEATKQIISPSRLETAEKIILSHKNTLIKITKIKQNLSRKEKDSNNYHKEEKRLFNANRKASIQLKNFNNILRNEGIQPISGLK